MILKRLLIALALLAIAPASAMDNTSVPAKFPIYWANSASASYVRNIPVPSQIGISTGAASLTDGFPPVTFLPISSGGVPPDGRDFNGILRQITQAVRWAQAGGLYTYDSAFSTSVGGYPKNARLQSAVLTGRIWVSTADNNTTDPDSQTAANWVPAPFTTRAGDPVPSFSSQPPPGTVPANGRTVGNTSSNATNRANADTYWLFVAMWSNCSSCQLYNSSGSPITRGTSANADWNANDAIATTQMSGAQITGADGIGGTSTSFLSGVPVVAGNSSTPTSLLGENLHTLVAGEIPTISSSTTVSGTLNGSTQSFNASTSNSTSGGGAFTVGNAVSSISLSVSVSGSLSGSSSSTNTGGGAHNIVPRTFLAYWNLSL